MTVPDILLDQARSQLARQEAALNTIRNQAIAVFSASGVAASLFAPRLLTSNRLAASIAALLFIAGTYSVIQTVKPRDFNFGLKLPGWLKWWEDHQEADTPELAAARGIADQLDQLREANKPALNDVADWYKRLCYAFGLQVVAWIVASLIR